VGGADHMGEPVRIAPATRADAGEWCALRSALWPDTSQPEHEEDIGSALADEETFNVMARSSDGKALGFAEATLRHDYVNGTKTSPVVFLEGIYVVPEARGEGVARALVAAIEAWGRDRGCTEFASDAPIGNEASQAMHAALGFEETQRVVYFRKVLG
jgi:aminoglycoside 6'-N-acetyltransferase I